MDYRAIKKDNGDELKHWKYIKRVKKNGKWQYYYDDTELRKFKIELTENTKKKRKHTENVYTTVYKKSNGLFDKERTRKRNKGLRYNRKTGEWYYKQHFEKTVKTQGKLSRAIAKGEKWIFDKFISNKRKSTKSL